MNRLRQRARQRLGVERLAVRRVRRRAVPRARRAPVRYECPTRSPLLPVPECSWLTLSRAADTLPAGGAAESSTEDGSYGAPGAREVRRPRARRRDHPPTVR